MSEDKRFTWLLEVEVPDHWVKDGFVVDQAKCQDVAEAVVKFAFHDAVKVRVVRAPDPSDLWEVQNPGGTDPQAISPADRLANVQAMLLDRT